ncbi:MAG: glycosyl hydrolase [Bacteroidetes bacterium]|nr:glycosyl hydrolase [Bacteroidota bacterium]MCY4232936.1 glycosyl hydrolase [Bacteroidota bacterium]
MNYLIRITLLLLLLISASASAQESLVSETDFSGIKLRNVGPAFTSGRIADIAMHPDDDNLWYIAVGSGGVWKTVNAGTTWESIFDNQPSYSIGAITLDPQNPHTVWVGTGENVGGRHVGYGDGIYRSHDGGQSWDHMGLKESMHISRIVIHPENSDVIWVAAQGPLWYSGGDRGLYMTTDGGQSWQRTLGDSEWVGVTDVVIDPRDPDVLYAATWQRHRNVAAYMGGGPGSGLHKSTDGGQTWQELTKGIPTSNLGKIGLTISPQNPDIVYAAIELDVRTGGIFMSSDRGASWEKMSDAVAGATGPHYYQELYASPHQEGTIYLMDVRVQVSHDHGRTFYRMSGTDKHVDNHAMGFRMDDPDYILMGTDGGLFQTYDGTKSWDFIGNLPVTQYYKVAVDDHEPFYRIFGGTQDNGSHGGPSQTVGERGIRNSDWFMTLGGDGHQSAVEPGNPNIIYAQSQQGRLHRVDMITGEQTLVQPQANAGEDHERYNWDAPILVSPHVPTTIYFASYRVWKSTNRGDSWVAISGDLTRDQERIELPIMGRVQSYDNPWDFYAMSVYNTITSLAESPMEAGLLYAGTDDGLIHVTENDGESWSSMEVGDIDGIPSGAFVNHLYADLHDANVVYAALDHHKFGDLSPYLIKSNDRGRSWTSMTGNLPDRTLIWRIVQDHVNPNLLFTATEFGVYFTVDGGQQWMKLKSDANISFRDVVIQQRENDLVAASFGRGFFVLDDYTPLRSVNEELLSQDAHLFETPTAKLFIDRDFAGSSQGTNYFAAPNPPFGATFTYYLREGFQSLKQIRTEKEKEIDADEDIPFPGWDALDAETNEVEDQVYIVVTDAAGHVAGRVNGSTSKGIHRVTWNLRYPSSSIVTPGSSNEGGSFSRFLATPGTYSASLVRVRDGVETVMSGPISFDVELLVEPALEGKPADEINAYRMKIASLMQRANMFSESLEDHTDLIDAMQTAHMRASNPSPDLVTKLHSARTTLLKISHDLEGYESKQGPGERNKPTVMSRLFVALSGVRTTYGPTQLHQQSLEIGEAQLIELESALTSFKESVLPELTSALEATGAPPIMK